MRFDDPEAVARDYADERGLEGRRSAYEHSEGPDAREVAFAAVAEVAPRRVLEVGCGPGELAARFGSEIGARVAAIDNSPRMVELARGRGIEADVGDVQDLGRFGDESFDCAVAAWMLYHVPDLERGLAELARVLRPGGRLVAVTNAPDHLREVDELVGVERAALAFDSVNADGLLRGHFERVERREAFGWLVFPDRRAVEVYVEASRTLQGGGEVPADFEGPLRVRRRPVVFVAEKAA